MNHRHFSSLLIISLSVSACSLSPRYEAPRTSLPATYQQTSEQKETAANLSWWEMFKDEQLQNLLRQALAENRDLQVAVARIAEARARLGFTRADQLPFVSGVGNASRIDPGSAAGGRPYNSFGLFGDLSFEVDLWGKLASATAAQQAELLATEYARSTVELNLVSTVASLYFQLQDLDQRLKVAQKTAKNRTEALGIIRARFKQGIIPELDVNQAESELEDARIAGEQFKRQIGLIEQELRYLLATPQMEITRGKDIRNTDLEKAVPLGLPADLLQRRPDVLLAEQRLKAEYERLGVARAGQYPGLTLRGSLGLQSSEAEDLADADSLGWSLAAGLVGPIVDWGKNRSRVEIQEAKIIEAEKSYEQTVLLSLKEVENARFSMLTYWSEYQSRQRQLKSASNALRLATARYNDGVSPYYEVLDGARVVFAAELGASESYRLYLNSLVQLYRALGGGWLNNPQPAPPASTAPRNP